VLRSRGGDLQFTVQPADAGGSIVYNVQAERIVGDFGVDKGINIGATVETPAGPRAQTPDDWRPVVLEIAPDLSEALAAERDRKARRQLISRPAQYRAGELRIVSGGSLRTVTLVAGAVATLGRNSTTPGADYACNDISLRVEPVNEARHAAATQQISGHAHLTLRYDGQQAVLTDGSTHGTLVNRTRKLARGESVALEDRLDVRVAGVLDLLFEAFRSADRDGRPAPTALAQAPREELDRTLVGFDKPGELDAVRIRRPGNLGGELEHVVLVRQARIGSSPYDCIQVRGRGVRERHARLLVDRGQFWLERLAEDGAVRLNDEPVEVGQRVGMRGGDVIEIGEARLTFAVH
jgi:pSer/pThr/pTyr-binding forkhead associated (FHA) protein